MGSEVVLFDRWQSGAFSSTVHSMFCQCLESVRSSCRLFIYLFFGCYVMVDSRIRPLEVRRDRNYLSPKSFLQLQCPLVADVKLLQMAGWNQDSTLWAITSWLWLKYTCLKYKFFTSVYDDLCSDIEGAAHGLQFTFGGYNDHGVGLQAASVLFNGPISGRLDLLTWRNSIAKGKPLSRRISRQPPPKK